MVSGVGPAGFGFLSSRCFWSEWKSDVICWLLAVDTFTNVCLSPFTRWEVLLAPISLWNMRCTAQAWNTCWGCSQVLAQAKEAEGGMDDFSLRYWRRPVYPTYNTSSKRAQRGERVTLILTICKQTYCACHLYCSGSNFLRPDIISPCTKNYAFSSLERDMYSI